MKKLLMAIMLAGLAVPTAVSAETYICKIKPRTKGNWIPETLAIDFDPQTGDVIVNDEYIMHYHGKPVAGKVVANNSKRITFTWILPSVKNSQGQTALRFNFRASYLKNSRKMIVTSNPSGYSNNFRGDGTCEFEK